MDKLIEAARNTARDERQQRDDMAARMPEERQAIYVADPDVIGVYMRETAASVEYRILGTSYPTPPSVLGTMEESMEELRAIEAARAARDAAEGGGQ
jgi:hypothetical protein